MRKAPASMPSSRYVRADTDWSQSASGEGTSRLLPKKRIQLFPIATPKRIQVDTPKQRLKAGLNQLEGQAKQINQLSKQLEEAIWRLKAIATEVDEDRQFLQSQRRNRDDSICEYRDILLPVVRQKSSGRLVLMSRSVDLAKDKRTTSPPKRLQQRLVKRS